MKKFTYLLVVACIFFACNSGNQSQQASQTPIGQGLDLKALGNLAKTCKDAASFEQQLNQPNGINNLDLDGSGNVTYIKVTEYGSGDIHGFSLTAEPNAKEKQEIATVELHRKITNSDTTLDVTVTGNKIVYGDNNNSYTASYPYTNFLIAYWLFMPHSMYYSPYSYGCYPSYYHSYRCVPYSSYSSRSICRTTTVYKTTSYSAGASSPNRNCSSPTVSQKSYSTRSSSKSVGSGGFSSSKSSSSSSHSSSSSSHSYGSSGSHSFGGGGRRSDKNAKHNIEKYSQSLATVLELQPVTYFYNSDIVAEENVSSKKQIGLLAQDVEKLIPEVVTTDNIGLKRIQYDLLVPVLINSIKELNSKIEKQQKVIDSLKLKK